MSMLNRTLLQSWVEEFRTSGFLTTGSIRVIEREDDETPHDGLVMVGLSRAATVAYLQLDSSDTTRWVATMEPREETIEMDAAMLLQLSAELAVISALCSFLQTKTGAVAR